MPVVLACCLVRTVPLSANTFIRCQAQPAKLMATPSTRHMIASAILHDIKLTARTTLTILLDKLLRFLHRLIALSNMHIILCTRHPLMKRDVVGEARLEPAGLADDKGVFRAAIVDLPVTAAGAEALPVLVEALHVYFSQTGIEGFHLRCGAETLNVGDAELCVTVGTARVDPFLPV